jgi:hypothetical protein
MTTAGAMIAAIGTGLGAEAGVEVGRAATVMVWGGWVIVTVACAGAGVEVAETVKGC